LFEQTAQDHLSGKNCFRCNGSKKLTTEEFIEKAKLIHGNRYDYSSVKYINNYTKINIICKQHGMFVQTPNNHLRNHGCPICNLSKGEKEIQSFLFENEIKFQREKIFEKLNQKRFDFYLPKYNIAIEYDGIQHFKSIDFFGGEDCFIKRKQSDEIKNQFCIDNNIKLIRIPYTKLSYIGNILKEIL